MANLLSTQHDPPSPKRAKPSFNVDEQQTQKEPPRLATRRPMRRAQPAGGARLLRAALSSAPNALLRAPSVTADLTYAAFAESASGLRSSYQGEVEQLGAEVRQRDNALGEHLKGLRRASMAGHFEFDTVADEFHSATNNLIPVLDTWVYNLSEAIAKHNPSARPGQVYGSFAMAKERMSSIDLASIAVREMAALLQTISETIPVNVASVRIGNAVLLELYGPPAIVYDESSEVNAVTLGAALLDLLVSSARHTFNGKTSVSFVHSTQYDPTRRERLGAVVPHDEVSQIFAKEVYSNRYFLRLPGSEYAPMICPPVSYSRGLKDGGYLTLRKAGQGLIPHPSAAQKQALIKADLSAVVRGLDALGSVAWRINEDAFNMVSDLRDTSTPFGKVPGEDVATLVDQRIRLKKKLEDLNGTKEADSSALVLDEAKQTEAKRVKIIQKIEIETLRKQIEAKLSRRITLETVLRHGQKMLDADAPLYYPYNMDFRGRVYPMSMAVSHVGEDTARGLLTFAKPKPLGERGFFWLKVHLANQMGHDKLPLPERAQWVDDKMPAVLQAVEQPFSPSDAARRLWYSSSKPAQAYAACLEIARAVRTGHPASYLSDLPVHQDGSCNGLQHYAALGRDSLGGAKVNLVPMDKPADVYSEIARNVGTTVQQIADSYQGELDFLLESGIDEHSEVDQKSDAFDGFLAKMVLPHIIAPKVARKIVKQTVMTSVYGVTLVGARAQIEKQLVALNEEAKSLQARGGPLINYIDDRLLPAVSMFLARLTMEAIGNEFRSAKSIMAWLQALSRVASRDNGQPVCWVTPLGLPVSQPYLRKPAKLVRTAMQKVYVASEDLDDRSVNVFKQRTALAPNFVHSLDSTHMLMTATACRERGIAFAAVHDSFWTHAATVDDMNHTLREEFVNLHSQDLLYDLWAQVQARYPLCKVPKPPQMGNLDIKQVLESKYFFA